MRAVFGGKHVHPQVLRLYRQCPEARNLSHHLLTVCRTEQVGSHAAVHGEAPKW